jgi:hypothetical protein
MNANILALTSICSLVCTSTLSAAKDDVKPTPDRHAAQSHPDQLVLADFHTGMDVSAWRVEDDVVMGGRSKGAFSINTNGHAVFSGYVSLENNGGFSSVQHYFDPLDVSPYRCACLRVKGDGKRYRLLVESEPNQRHYYVYAFQTGREWQTVKVPLKEMYPTFRGRRLDIPNYPAQTMAMVRVLIGNKQAETFRLEIDKIWLE